MGPLLIEGQTFPHDHGLPPRSCVQINHTQGKTHVLLREGNMDLLVYAMNHLLKPFFPKCAENVEA